MKYFLIIPLLGFMLTAWIVTLTVGHALCSGNVKFGRQSILFSFMVQLLAVVAAFMMGRLA